MKSPRFALAGVRAPALAIAIAICAATPLTSLAASPATIREIVIPIPNGGFEDGLASWTIATGEGMSSLATDQAASGSRSLRIVDASDSQGSNAMSARVPITKPGRYDLRGMVYAVSGDGLGVYLRAYDAKGVELKDSAITEKLGGADKQWRPFTVTIYASERAAFLQLWIHSYTKSIVTAYLDNLEFVTLEGGPDLAKDMQTIKQRLLDRLLAANPQTDTIKGYVDTLQPDGSWKDVNYKDQNRAGWDATKHLTRALQMAQAWRVAASPLKGDARLKGAIVSALGYWTEHDFQNPNWFHNRIGTPRLMSDTLLLMEGELPAPLWEAAIGIVRHAKPGMTGANLVWVASINVNGGCLEGKPEVVMDAMRRVANEIRISTKEGSIQPDFSFHQHGPQLYSGGYGLGFCQYVPRLAVVAMDTVFAIPQEKLDLLARYVLDGEQWFVRGKTFDYSASGRGLSRKGGDGATGLIDVCENMAIAYPQRAAEFQAFARRIEGKPAPADPAFEGNRHFWHSDIMCHHREDFYASVRMTSNRLRQTEKVNDENQRGEFLADGTTYIYRTGAEYRDIFPVWDWRRVPGTTCEQQSAPPEAGRKGKGKDLGERSFVGGVSDGRYGLAAEDFARDKLTARKAWFFLEREFVCLGAGVSCATGNPIFTSINQCLLKGPVTVGDGARRETATTGSRALDRQQWVFHDGIGYVFPRRDAVQLKNEAQKGSWWDINRKYKKKEISENVFSLWIDHGKQPRDASYEYVVAPAVPLDQMDAYAKALPFAVIANTPRQQAVWSKDLALLQVAFWEAGKVAVPGGATGLSVAVDKPCLLMLQQKSGAVQLSVSNPDNKNLELSVTLNRRLNGDDCEWLPAEDATRIRLTTPAGPSLVRQFAI